MHPGRIITPTTYQRYDVIIVVVVVVVIIIVHLFWYVGEL